VTPALIYFGRAATLRREVGLDECYAEKWQIVPFAAGGEEFTPEGFSCRADMMTALRYYRSQYPQAEYVSHP
jgi:hypothetical protein